MTKTYFDVLEYLLSHGRKPKGFGVWAFFVGNSEEPVFTPRAMTYGEAKKWVKATFPKATDFTVGS